MAFWKPYVPDLPLDLSKGSTEGSLSPVSDSSIPVEYPGFSHYSQEPAYLPHFAGYPYLPEACQELPPQPLFISYPYQQGYLESNRAATLSPPESVESESSHSKSSHYMVEADALTNDLKFQAFKRDALQAMAEKNGGSLLVNNPRMRRIVKSTKEGSADDSYKKQRERNNLAAKQSRDRRKQREIDLSLKVAYLKMEVANLKSRLAVKSCSRCCGELD